MPVSPSLAENLAADVVELYAEAERVLLARIAKSLAKGLDAPHWVEKKLAEVQFLRHQTERLVADLGNRAAAQVAVALAEAYNRGGASAAADLAALLKVGLEEVSAPLLGLPSVELLVSETMRFLIAANARMSVAVREAFRSIITESEAQVLIGTQTRRQAAQAALDRFAAKGITGFVDKSGRGWNLASYVEMAMRTGCGKAAVQGANERFQAFGQDLVIVSDAPRECPLCRKHEGKVYSLSGTDQKYPSLDSARAEGLFHVNCRHATSLYQEGITKPMKGTADPEGYAATTKLRYLERNVRQSKRLEAAALDDAARAKAHRRVLDYQQKIRAHVATTKAKRQPPRERLGAL
jgi:hypothetical protein